MSEERAHSKFSASGSDRWLKCAASVELEEKSPPSADNFWSKEGTLAHAVLETMLLKLPLPDSFDINDEMISHCERTAKKVFEILKSQPGAKLYVERRVYAMFVHPEMFGTVDGFIPGEEILDVIDFKYGIYPVDPERNTQMIQYALSIAESYNWNFKKVRFWILQPRAGKTWAKPWIITIEELRDYWQPLWHKGVARVLKGGSKPFPGSHCHWCRAKSICPAKKEMRVNKVIDLLTNNPIQGGLENGIKEKSRAKSKGQSESDETKSRAPKSFDESEDEDFESFD